MFKKKDPLELESLVEKAKLGDMKAKEKLYLELVNKVYYFALKTVKNTDDAMDIVQDSFIMAFDKLYTLKEANAFQTWLFRIVGNNCRALFNKQSKNILLDEEELEDLGNIEDEKENIPCEIIDQKETSHLVMEIIEKLPEAQRSCILLYYYNEFSVGEIAEILVCSAGTVKSRLNYARKQIKEELLILEKKKGTKLYSTVPLGILLGLIKLLEEEEGLATETINDMGANIIQLFPNQGVGNIVNVENDIEVAKTTILSSVKAKIVVSIVAMIVIGVIILRGVIIDNSKVRKNEVYTNAEAIASEYKEDELFRNIQEIDEDIKFIDPAIEKGIRYIIDKPKGGITKEDLNRINEIIFIQDCMTADIKRKDMKSISPYGIVTSNGVFSSDNAEENGCIKIGQFETLEDLANLENLTMVSFLDVADLRKDTFKGVNQIKKLHSILIKLKQEYFVVPDFSENEQLWMLSIMDSVDEREHISVDRSFSTKIDFSNVSKLKNLERLNIYVREIPDTSFISEVLELQNLFIECRGSYVLRFHKDAFTNKNKLETVKLSNNTILVFPEESKLSETIEIEGTDIIKQLPNIQEFIIRRSEGEQKDVLQ